MRKLVDVEEAAEMMNVSYERVEALTRQGKLRPAALVREEALYTTDEIDCYILQEAGMTEKAARRLLAAEERAKKHPRRCRCDFCQMRREEPTSIKHKKGETEIQYQKRIFATLPEDLKAAARADEAFQKLETRDDQGSVN